MAEQEVSIPAWELDLPLCVTSGQVFRWQPLSDGAWLGFAGERMLVVQPVGTRWRLSAPDGRDPLPAFLHLFRLEVDLKQVQARLVRRHPLWGEWIAALPGLRLMRWLDAEECLFSFLCTPANNIPRITGMIERLCERYGELIAEWNGRLWRAFPKAGTLANASEAELRALGFGYRARTLIQAARALAERGKGWLVSLRELPYKDAKRELCQLPGVGAKIADCVLLFGLDNPLAVPVDTHLWQAMQKWVLPHLHTRNLTARTYREVTDWFHTTFGELTGWAHQYLFTAHLLGVKE
ncbi:MAG: DNA glycosylase [Armatimonadota bacterium]